MNTDSNSEPPVGASGEEREAHKSQPQDGHTSPAKERNEAADKIANNRTWNQHPVNIRFSIKTLFSQYYVVVLAGPERRSKQRRQEERSHHPFAIRNNLWFVGSVFVMVVLICWLIGLWTGALIFFALLG